MDQWGAELELHARAGRAVLVAYGDGLPDPSDLQLPTGLGPALHEWALIAEAVRRAGAGDGEPGALVSQRGRVLAARLASSTGVPVGYADPIAGGIEVLPPGQDREPTPWVTGLPVSAATAVIVGVALLALSEGLTSVGSWLVVLANLLVAAGLAPSIWLARAVPIWRWLAYGTAAGILLTWLTLLLSLLG
ncbi:MAG: DUF2537 domain-containing protein [Pseudonocardiaceae bacterium]